MQILDLAIFLIYMLAIVGFGISFSFRKRTAQDFTTGGGRLPTWAIGMSIFATYVSSISFLALPGNAFSTNWNGFVFHLLHYDGDFFNKPLDNSFFSINFSENYLYIDLFFMSFKIYDRIR